MPVLGEEPHGPALPELGRGLARLQIHDESDAHHRRPGELVLAEALGLADATDEGAQFGGGEVCHGEIPER